MTAPPRTISIVAPCFNEEPVLPAFLQRTQAMCRDLGMTHEIILIDDGSSDRTWAIIAEAAAADPCVRGLRLRRNHGHQLALTAGLAASQGDAVLAIDADLQDPPELLPAMLRTMADAQADVVYGRRTARLGESWFKRASAALFYRLINRLSEVDIPADTGDFRLMRRPVVDILRGMPESHRFIRGMVAWIGGTQVPFDYVRDPRFAGTTKYPLRRMIRFAADALTGFSRKPLAMATRLGVLAGAASLGLGLYSLIGWLAGANLPGWTSLMAAFGVLTALQLFFLGVLGEYVGRLYEASRNRPLYLTAMSVGAGLALKREVADDRA